MKTKIQKEKFTDALGTLFHSWGGDTPNEVFWGANKLLNWFEEQFDVSLNIRFERDEKTFEDNYDEVIEVIENL